MISQKFIMQGITNSFNNKRKIEKLNDYTQNKPG